MPDSPCTTLRSLMPVVMAGTAALCLAPSMTGSPADAVPASQPATETPTSQVSPATQEPERYNPHVMLDKDNAIIPRACSTCHRRHAYPQEGEVDSEKMPQACSFCHHVPHDNGEGDFVTRSGRPKLRMSEPALCLRCHTQHVDFFDPGHIGAKASEAIRANIVSFEKHRLSQSSLPGKLGRTAAAVAEQLGLPLLGGDTVVCSTCHNPHQSGLFPPDSVLSLGSAPAAGDPVLVRLRLGRQTCLACHDK